MKRKKKRHEPRAARMGCPNCGSDEAHFVPPSFGDVGFYICHDRDCALRADGARPQTGWAEGCTCHLSMPVARSRPWLDVGTSRPDDASEGKA